MRAIVLSGGGAKGSYQIGAWKALKKLHVKYDIVTGTSVGALNGALMVQKTYHKAIHLWNNISYDDIFEMEKYSEEEILKVYKDGILNGGVDVSNLENTVKKYLRPKKFFKSKINYGLITVKFPSFKHVEKTKKNLNEKNLLDFLIASASCFPAFRVKKIDNQSYIDGGYYDNLPINLAVSLGADEIIAIDMNAIGLKKKNKYDVNVTLVSSRNKMDSILTFENKSTKRSMRLGYNDTMKVFKKLEGDKYTFKLNNLNKNLNKYKKKFLNNVKQILNEKNLNNLILENITFRKLYKNDSETINNTIEKMGYLFEMDDSYIYSIKKYNKLLLKKFNCLEINHNEIDNDIKKKITKVYFNNKLMIKYLYELYKNKKYNKLQKLCILFPDEFLMSIYIITIEGA